MEQHTALLEPTEHTAHQDSPPAPISTVVELHPAGEGASQPIAAAQEPQPATWLEKLKGVLTPKDQTGSVAVIVPLEAHEHDALKAIALTENTSASHLLQRLAREVIEKNPERIEAGQQQLAQSDTAAQMPSHHRIFP